LVCIKIIQSALKAVTSENPNLRYLSGKDIETVMEAKRNMSDEEQRRRV
jgi:hypothetical protein